MTRALKVTLIVVAIVAFIFGVMLLVFPNQFGALVNFPEFPQEVNYIAGLLGAMYVMLAVGFVLAARDPARHRTWVQAGLVGYALSLMMTISYLLRGAISWNQATIGFIIQVVSLIALVVLYPRKQVD